MKFEIGAMTVGDILDRGLKLLTSRLLTFYVIDLIALTPSIIFQVALVFISPTAGGGPSQGQLVAVLGGGLLVIVLALILQPIATAALLHVVAQEFVDKSVGIGDAFRFASRRFVSLLGTSLLVGLVVGVGLLFCIIPGILFSFWYVFAPQVVVVEGLSGNRALKRSKELYTGFRSRVLGVMVLFWILMVGVSLVAGLMQYVLPYREMVQTASGAQVAVIKSQTNYIINVVFSNLLNILIYAYSAVCWTLFYFDLRIRKEGFDLEVAAAQQAAELS